MMETQPLRVLVLYWPFRNILDFSIPISQSMPHCDWISEIHHLVTRNHELESNDNKILAKVHGSTIDKFYPFVANLTKFFLPILQPIFICRDYPTHPPDLAWLPILGTTPGPISHNLFKVLTNCTFETIKFSKLCKNGPNNIKFSVLQMVKPSLGPLVNCTIIKKSEFSQAQVSGIIRKLQVFSADKIRFFL